MLRVAARNARLERSTHCSKRAGHFPGENRGLIVPRMLGRPLRYRSLIASALAVLPYLVANVCWIVSATGTIIHMSKAEWAIWTLVSTLGLWLVCAAVLAVSAIVTKNNAWLSAVLSLIVFTGAGMAIEPHLWVWLLFPFDYSIGPWLGVTGLLSVTFANVLVRVRPADRFS